MAIIQGWLLIEGRLLFEVFLLLERHLLFEGGYLRCVAIIQGVATA